MGFSNCSSITIIFVFYSYVQDNILLEKKPIVVNAIFLNHCLILSNYIELTEVQL